MVIISKLNLQQARNLVLFAFKSKNSNLNRIRINYTNVKSLSTLNSSKFRQEKPLSSNSSAKQVSQVVVEESFKSNYKIISF